MADARTFSRRGLILAAGAALGGAALPSAIIRAGSAESPPTAAAEPAAFDPAAFVADLQAAGYEVVAISSVPQPGWAARAPTYGITPGPGRGFGEAFFAVMARWSDAIDACPDHVERVAAHLLEQRPRA